MYSMQQRTKPSYFHEPDLQVKRTCESIPDQPLNQPQANRLALVVLAVSPVKFTKMQVLHEIKPDCS